ncbi:MAG: superoxide reductase [Eubacteriaceae bacterium]|nr:superoxide reductase [Eubacteriaceae bacterium]
MNESSLFQCNDCTGVLLELHGTISQYCNHNMTELTANTIDASKEKHVPIVSHKDHEITVTVGKFPHPMTTDHSILWIFVKSRKGGSFIQLTPQDKPEASFHIDPLDIVAVYAYCDIHGLWQAQLDDIDYQETVCSPEFPQGCVGDD